MPTHSATQPLLMTTPTFFTGVGHARPDVATVAAAARPRALVVGPAGSGKSTLLRQLQGLLLRREVSVRVADEGTELDDVPPSEVLLVDDLHLLDTDRAEAVRARTADPRAALIVATRPWPRSTTISEVSRLLERSAPPIVLGRVSRSDVLTFLEDRGEVVSSACLDQLLTITGGVTWLVSHALATHHVRDCDDDARHHELRRDLEARIIHRLDSLDVPLRRMIELVSLGRPDNPGTSPEDAARADELIAQGYAEGLLLRNGSPVPVVRSAVHAAVPVHRLAELGAVVPDGVRSGLDESELMIRRARAAWGAGDLDAAAGLVDTALADATLAGRDDVTDIAAAVWAARGMMATGSDVYGARPPHSAASAVRATLTHIGVGAAEHLEAPPGTDDAAARRSSADAPSTLGIAMRLLDDGLRSSLEREYSPSTLSHLVRAAELYTASRATDPLAELPAIVAAAVAIGAGDLATAQHVIESAVAAGHGGAWARRRLLLWQAWVAIQGERPTDARDALARAEEVTTPSSPRDEMLHQTILVTLAHRYEDVPSLEAAWQVASEGVRHLDVDLYTLLPLSSLITSAARTGDSTTLAPHFAQGLELLRRLGSPPLWSTHLRWAGVQQCILLNRPDSLGPHARALVSAAPRNRVAETMAHAGGVWVAVLAGSVDADDVEAAARALASAGLGWDGARLAGHGARRAEDRKVAARLLSCARELHPHDMARRGAPAPERSALRVTTEVEALSERELDVARLILQGKTYIEIGETIFISPRTVEHHVAHIRRRLAATSRSDLIAKLRLAIEPTADAPPRTGTRQGNDGKSP